MRTVSMPANNQVGREPNPMSGPFFVEGAEPGDGLAVKIDRIDMDRSHGWTRQGLAWNVVDPAEVSATCRRARKYSGRLTAMANAMFLRDPPERTAQLVDAAGTNDRLHRSGTRLRGSSFRRQHRGPMAATWIIVASPKEPRIHFPVFEKGALLFLGDVHAAQGDGEIAGTGIETSAQVQFTVRVLKAKPQKWPRGENANEIFTIGNARPLEQALQHASTEMMNWLMADYGLDRVSAAHVMAMVGAL